jgi:hypothetical protein
MICGHISDGDNLFRHAIYPIPFKGNRYAPEKWLKFYDQADGAIHGSLAWERYVPTAKHVHGYGCRVASRMNEKMQAAGVSKNKTRRVYCGAYQLKGKAVRVLAGTEGLEEILSVDVVHHIEEGEVAHTNLRIVLKAGDHSIEGTKTAIIDRLWNVCTGPLVHVCDCDRDVTPHPSLSLISAPAGVYVDTRSSFMRQLCLIRFYIYSWLLRIFYHNAVL